MNLKNFIKNNQTKIVLLVGYVAVASLAFGLGQLSVDTSKAPSNYNANTSVAQTDSTASNACDGKIKGSASLIYHMPGGAFYEKTTSPIKCFDTEAEAQAAGFRKSAR